MNAFEIRIIIGALITIGILAGTAPCVPAQSEEGLVAEWHFDEGSGSIAKDSSGNGNDGVIHDATWVDGKFGKALKFDGKDDYVDCGNDALFDMVNDFSLEVWIYPTGTGSGGTEGGIVVNKERTYEFARFRDSSNRWAFANTNPGWDWHDTGGQAPLNQWTHIGITYSSSAVIMTYINGGLVDTYNGGGDVSIKTSNLWIGGRSELSQYFDGIIDEVRIYNRALTAEKIKAHYEGKQMALSLTKSASPHSIKRGQTTTITLTVKNTGTTEIKDIEIANSVPADFILISGETSKKYASLKPKDSRDFQFVIQSTESGTFNLGEATATYADEKGNYYTAKSNTAEIKVIPSLEPTPPSTTPTPTKTPSSASVNLYGEKTDVVLGEDILLRLSAVNLITKPSMTVQVIIIPPSGMSVTSAEFTKTIAGQYATTYKLEPGDGKDIEVRIKSNQVGDFVVEGRIVYYFGDDITTGEDHTLTLPIKVRPEKESTPEPTATEQTGETSGFTALILLLALLLLTPFLLRKRR